LGPKQVNKTMKITSLYFNILLLPFYLFPFSPFPLFAQTTISDYKIAYNVHVPDTTKDDWEIMIMNSDGSAKKNISSHPDVAWTYHAHKDKLYFVSDRDTTYRHYFLYEMNSDGKNLRKVTDLRLEDSWISSRHDGKELIVVGRIGAAIRHQFFLINTATGQFQQLTRDTAAYHGHPCFSPDGKQIVFSYKKNKRDRNSIEELYLMNADGTRGHQLTHYPMDNISVKEPGYKAASAKWHPSGAFITFLSLRDGRNSIYAIRPDGSATWKLLDNDEADGWHDWSPDGNWLVYDKSDIAGNQYHIMLMNWQTKETVQLTDTMYRSQLAPVFVK
jgi:TolB protein